MLSPSSRYHAVFKVAAFINFWAKVMLFSCLQAYMTALNSFEKLKIDIIIYFRMFSFSNDLKKYKKSHSAILIFGQLWLESGPLCGGQPAVGFWSLPLLICYVDCLHMYCTFKKNCTRLVRALSASQLCNTACVSTGDLTWPHFQTKSALCPIWFFF